MSERIRSNPRLFTLAIGLLAGAAVWALLPREAEAAQPNTKDLVLKLQDEVFQLGLKIEEIPTNWLPRDDRQRFELVLPQQGPSGTVYEGVLDHRTGLIWQRRPGDDSMHFHEARMAAVTCQDGGVMGWRLPFADELLTLAQVSRAEGTFTLGEDFPLARDSMAQGYWTQTAYENQIEGSPFPEPGRYHTVVDFGYEQVYPIKPGVWQAQVWLVMGPGGAHR